MDSSEEALEEALKRIQGDSNESDEDNELLNSSHVPPGGGGSSTNTAEDGQSMRLLCMPHKTRQQQTMTSLPKFHQREPNITVKNSRNSTLSRDDFCRMVCEKLDCVSKQRVYMRQQAQNQAREQGKSYKEIMSLEWTDSPNYINKYISLLTTTASTTSTTDKLHQREPSCSDSGLGNSYLGQSSSDLCHWVGGADNYAVNRRLAPDSVSYYSSEEHKYYSNPSINDSSYMQQCTPLYSSFANNGGPCTNSLSNSIISSSSRPCSVVGPPPSTTYFRSSSLSISSRPSSVIPPPPPPPHHHHQITLHSSNHTNSYNQQQQRHYQSITASSSTSSLFSSSLFSSSSASNTNNKQQQQLLVAYTMTDAKNTFAKRVPTYSGSSITFKQFRDEIFARKGSYRFFFKSYCVELNDTIFEEINNETQFLPLFKGKIVGHVEKISGSDL